LIRVNIFAQNKGFSFYDFGFIGHVIGLLFK